MLGISGREEGWDSIPLKRKSTAAIGIDDEAPIDIKMIRNFMIWGKGDWVGQWSGLGGSKQGAEDQHVVI